MFYLSKKVDESSYRSLNLQFNPLVHCWEHWGLRFEICPHDAHDYLVREESNRRLGGFKHLRKHGTEEQTYVTTEIPTPISNKAIKCINYHIKLDLANILRLSFIRYSDL